MSWLNSFRKKTVENSPAVPFIVNYSKDKYTAYWEKLIGHDVTGKRVAGIGVVKFYERATGKVLSYSTFEKPTNEELHSAMNSHIIQKMENFRK